MAELPETIARIWGFLLGPVLTLAVFGGLSGFLAPRRAAQLRERAVSWSAAARVVDVSGPFERLGLNKVLPILTFFVASFVLYALYRSVLAAGEVFPGRVVYFGEATLARVDYDGTLNEYWVKNPRLEYPSQVASHASDRISELVLNDSLAVGSGSRQWQKAIGEASSRLNYVKGLMVVSLILAIAELTLRGKRISTLIRLALSQLVLVVVATYFVFAQVYSIEQQAFSNLRTLSYSLSQESAALSLDSARVREMDDYRAEARNRWWRFDLVSSGYPAWLYHQLFGEAALDRRRAP